jgi:hypothetical protein
MKTRFYPSIFQNLLKVKNPFLRITCLLVILSFILDVYYYFYITEAFSHLGFVWKTNAFKFLLSKMGLCLLLFISYFIYEKSPFLYSAFLIFTFLLYLPNATLFALSDSSYKPFVSILFFLATFYLSTFVKFNVPKFRIEQRKADIILISISLLCLLVFIFAFRDNIYWNTLFLKDIYSTREIFSEKMSGGLSYLYHLAVKTILPVTLIHFMIRKKTTYIYAVLLILVYLYLVSGNKIVYFSIFIYVFFYYCHGNFVKKIMLYFQLAMVALLLIPLVDFFIFYPSNILLGTFVNRFLFIPALLTQWYFDYFDGRPFFFAESHFFKLFFQSPYDLPVGFQISKVYLNTTDAYANNGVVSDGFMNLGYIGVVLYSLTVALLFGIIQSFKLNSGYFGLYFMYIYMLLSAPLFSCFITGGILFFLIMAVYIIRNDVEELGL